MNQPQATAPGLAPDRILQTGLAFWASKTLLSAIELNLFTVLAAAPQTAGQLLATLGLHPRAARDFFDTLVALGFLTRTDGVYSNTPETDLFLDRNKPSYIGGLLEMANSRLYSFWGRLTEGLRTGEPQNEVREGTAGLFETLYSDTARLRGFLAAMTGISHGSNMAIASQLPWSKYRTFADIGTAQGDLAVQIALGNPHLQGIGFDLPMVAPIFEEYATHNGVANRLRFQPGDFFTDPLPGADAILMGHVLHDWGLDDKKMLLRKAWEALPEGGMVAIYEAIIDDERSTNAFGLMMSLNMLIETPAGSDYTGADCRGWLTEAGFRDTEVRHLAGPDSVVIAFK